MRGADRVRVVVTGIGVKSPAGNTLPELFASVIKAASSAAVVPELRDAGCLTYIACAAAPFDIAEYLHPRELRQIDRPTVLALCAAMDAVGAAALPADLPADRVGVHLGTGIGGLPSMESIVYNHGAEPNRLPVHSVTKTMANSAATRIAMRYGFGGSCNTYATACASGTTAIGEAARRIQYGELDVAVTGGYDSAITKVIMAGFGRMRALSMRNTEPDQASRPFDAARDGFVMGEGAAMLVLEREDLARARGARIYGEVLGYATNSDAFHVVAPRPGGEAAAACMRAAIADAGLTPADIGHVNAHGTSTQLNDAAEAAALHRCFGDDGPPVTAVKGVTGHLIGGSGALEAAVALLCAERLIVPPVANLTDRSEDHLVDVVAGEPRTITKAPVLSNSFGFGGQNACLVLTRTGEK